MIRMSNQTVYLPYPLKYKLPLQYLSVNDWNNLVNDLLFALEKGLGMWYNYYNNGNMSNLGIVQAKSASLNNLNVNGYQALWNLKPVNAYTFGGVLENWLNDLQNIVDEFNDIFNELQTMKIPIYPQKTISFTVPKTGIIEVLKNAKLDTSVYANELKYFVYLLSYFKYGICTTSYKIFPHASSIAGIQTTISGSVDLESLVPAPFANNVRYAIVRNLGSSPIQVNDGAFLLPGDTLYVNVDDILVTYPTYAITIENSQSDPTPAPFQVLLNLNLSSIFQTTHAIALQNSQSSSTSSPFQAMLNLNLQGVSLASPISDLLSLAFCADKQCTQPLYAWIESYSSDLSSVNVWVNLPNGVPASSTTTIYMQVTSALQYPYTGIAPQLTSSYAEYDNGEDVFTFYDNFAGTSLDTTKWTSYIGSDASISIDNGITFTTGSTNAYITTVTDIGFSPQTVFDTYFVSISASNVYQGTGIGIFPTNSDTSNGYIYMTWNGANSNGGTVVTHSISSGGGPSLAGPNFPFSGNAIISGYWLATGNEGFAVNYNFEAFTDTTNTIGSANYYSIGQYYGTESTSSTWQWVRVRAMPPNNVMPSLVSFTPVS